MPGDETDQTANLEAVLNDRQGDNTDISKGAECPYGKLPFQAWFGSSLFRKDDQNCLQGVLVELAAAVSLCTIN